MLKEKLTYKDFVGNERTDEFNFHLRESDIAEILMVYPEGLPGLMRELNTTKDRKRVIEIFKYILQMSIGKFRNSNRFEKSEEITAEFMESNAYSDMFMKLAGDAEYAATFMANILPADLKDKYAADVAEKMGVDPNEEKLQTIQVDLQNKQDASVPAGMQTTEPEMSKLDRSMLEPYPDRLKVFAEKELFDMSENDFRRLNGSDPQKWPQKILVIAAQRKTAA